MRLLKTEGCVLVEAKDIPPQFPPYAILSHTWISAKEEITYQDMKTRKEDISNGVYKQLGWAKLERYCKRANKDGWEWAWMDTCCIDKTNPADTQEAINAMFRWYQDAGMCYAYLDDVCVQDSLSNAHMAELGDAHDDDLDERSGKENIMNEDSVLHKKVGPRIIKSNWFTRGWTLQELLAPDYLVFVDHDWRRIGTRESWAAEIEKASRIEPKHLTRFNPTDFKAASIAMRLSWASRRKTTVEEDESYSLLGLFGISLPLIYGEGRWRAFNRLQRQLISVYDDDSIFAWKIENKDDLYHVQRQSYGILAPSIRQFWDASKIESFGFHDHSFSLTNQGLQTNAKRWSSIKHHNQHRIALNCGAERRRYITIKLQRDKAVYVREELQSLDHLDAHDKSWKLEPASQNIFIREGNYSNPLTGSSIFVIRYPTEVTFGPKYMVDFSLNPHHHDLQSLDDEFDGSEDPQDGNEICLKPDQLVFINMTVVPQLDAGQEREHHCRQKFDLVICMNKNGFPSAYILPRQGSEALWQRIEDPVTSSSRPSYISLAKYVHDSGKLGRVLPLMADVDDSTVVSIHLLPKAPRDQTPSSTNRVYVRRREYFIKMSVESKKKSGSLSTEELRNKRIRIS